MESAIRSLRDQPGLQFLHVVTKKGKGLAHAEDDPIKYHGVSKGGAFAETPPMKVEQDKPTKIKTYTQWFSQWICDRASSDDAIVAITPAMREGSGLVEFEQQFPSRYFDVGIAEQHAVTFAAGLSCAGMYPVVAIYSTFLQRAYDQLIHDVALQNLPMLFAVDRGGLVGADGATHQGVFDLCYLRCVPNLTILTPSDEDELWRMLNTARTLPSPVVVRYPRGVSVGVDVAAGDGLIPLRAECLRQSSNGQILILFFGAVKQMALAAGETLDATVIDGRVVKPLDADRIVAAARAHRVIVTVEDNAVAGGAGSAVAECLQAHRVMIPLLLLGVPDEFIEHGTQQQQREYCGLSAERIVEAIRQWLPAS